MRTQVHTQGHTCTVNIQWIVRPVQRTSILYYTILYYTILYYTILYYTILYYTILYYTFKYSVKFIKVGQTICLCELTIASLWLLEGKSMFATLMTCLLLMSVLVVGGNCTLVVKGTQGLPGLERPNPRLCAWDKASKHRFCFCSVKVCKREDKRL